MFQSRQILDSEKGVDRTSITLTGMMTKKRSELPAILLREDNRYLYFTAETLDFHLLQ
jgi:PGF-pre-PGF domain-containing protein